MTQDKYDALERFTPLFEPPQHSFEGFLRHRERKRRRRRIATGATGTAVVAALVATLATVLPHGGASTGTEPDMTIGETPIVTTSPRRVFRRRTWLGSRSCRPTSRGAA